MIGETSSFGEVMGLLGVCEYFGRLIHGILPQYRLHYPPLSELDTCLKRLKYTDFSSRFGVQRSCLKKHQFIAVSWLQTLHELLFCC